MSITTRFSTVSRSPSTCASFSSIRVTRLYYHKFYVIAVLVFAATSTVSPFVSATPLPPDDKPPFIEQPYGIAVIATTSVYK